MQLQSRYAARMKDSPGFMISEVASLAKKGTKDVNMKEHDEQWDTTKNRLREGA